MKIVTPDQMRDLERRAVAPGDDLDALMERAGLMSARAAWDLLRDVRGDTPTAPSIVVLIGPGNNGGDGLVAARVLREWGADVTAVLLSPRPPDDPKRDLARDAGVVVTGAPDADPAAALAAAIEGAAVAVDAVLGIGAARPLDGALRDAMALLNDARASRSDLRILALDVPTGVDAATGAADPHALRADATVAFAFPKPGLVRLPGAALTGALTVADIGVPEALADDVADELVTASWARTTLPRRPVDAHKGTFGRVLALAGSRSYVGAAYLACMGAARAGAGYVTLATTPTVQALLTAKLTESTYLLLPERPNGDVQASPAADALRAAPCDALLAGCGLGQGRETQRLLERFLLAGQPLGVPMLLDADVLNFLAATPDWPSRLAGDAVVTPHPGEMARLLDCSIAEVEADRVETARRAAVQWGVTVVLKGAYTVVASPSGQTSTLPYAVPALATAGTGDVLAGVIAALLAQRVALYDAAALGAYVHAAAGQLVADDVGPAGAIASDLLPALPRALRAIAEGRHTDPVRRLA